MKPLISIGLPVKDGFKNRSQNDINLEKSLNSILNQTYKNLEIIYQIIVQKMRQQNF